MTIPVSIFAKVLTDTDQTKLESTFSLSVSTYLLYVFIWPAIPILRQERDWVGGVRKMAFVADIQYYLWWCRAGEWVRKNTKMC